MPTRYFIAAMLALMPTALAVAYEQVPKGADLSNGGGLTWLPPAAAIVLFFAAETAARLWLRLRGLSIVLLLVVLVAGGVWWKSMANLGVFLHAKWGVTVIVPGLYVLMYTVVGLVSGATLARGPKPAARNVASQRKVSASR